MVWIGMALAALGLALLAPRGARATGGVPRHYAARGQVITTSGYDDPSTPLDAWKLRGAGLVLVAAGLGIVVAAL